MSVNTEGKKVAVIGGRDFNDKDRLFSILTKNRAKIKLIVSGGANGADTLGVEWAKAYGMPYLVFPALWRDPETGVYDRGAGFRRNHDIVKHSDVVIAFWDGVSGGTKNSIEIAKSLNKPLKIFSYPPTPKEVKPESEASDQPRPLETEESPLPEESAKE